MIIFSLCLILALGFLLRYELLDFLCTFLPTKYLLKLVVHKILNMRKKVDPKVLDYFIGKYHRLCTGDKQQTLKDLLVVAMVGFPGAKRREVAEFIAERIGGILVSANDIRMEMKEKFGGFDESVTQIVDAVAGDIAYWGCFAVVDADMNPARRLSLEKAIEIGDEDTKVLYVGVFTDLDNLIGNILMGESPVFFKGAGSHLKNGEGNIRAKVVELREVVRRYPNLYKWTKRGGGSYVLRNNHCQIIIDPFSENWQKQIEKVVGLVRYHVEKQQEGLLNKSPKKF